MKDFEIHNGELIKYTGSDKVVVLPESVTLLRDYAFYGCEQLEQIIINNQLTYIGDFAFYSCDNLTKIEIPASVMHIGGGAFSCCKKLESVIIYSDLKTLAKSTFYKCFKLKEIKLPNTITTIERSAFAFCEQLKQIQLPQSLTRIGESAFENCLQLREVIMPEGLKSVYKKAFYHCPNLTRIEVSSSLSNVGDGAFQTQSSLTFISNDTLLVHPVFFDEQWYYQTQKEELDYYQFKQSYMPHLYDLHKWKPKVQTIILINFLETYTLYKERDKQEYMCLCQEYKAQLLNDIIYQKHYSALNQGIEIGLFSTEEIEPYFTDITDREQKAKLLDYTNKKNAEVSVADSLEDELLSMF